MTQTAEDPESDLYLKETHGQRVGRTDRVGSDHPGLTHGHRFLDLRPRTPAAVPDTQRSRQLHDHRPGRRPGPAPRPSPQVVHARPARPSNNGRHTYDICWRPAPPPAPNCANCSRRYSTCKAQRRGQAPYTTTSTAEYSTAQSSNQARSPDSPSTPTTPTPTELNRYGDQAPISPGAPAAVARFGSSLRSASVRASLRRTGQMGCPW